MDNMLIIKKTDPTTAQTEKTKKWENQPKNRQKFQLTISDFCAKMSVQTHIRGFIKTQKGWFISVSHFFIV